MRFKPTWILLVIAVVVTGYFFIVEQPRHHREQAQNLAAGRLTSISPDAVATLTIERPDTTMRFSLTEGEWRMTAPASDIADAVSVNTLVRTVLGAEIERRVETTDDLREFGLAQPSAVVTIGARSGDQIVLSIGDFSLTSTHCYAQRGGSGPVILVPAGVKRYAERSVFDFRDKRVARVEVDSVAAYTLQSPRGRLEWRRPAGGVWYTIAAGDTILGDPGEVEAVLREIHALRAGEILPESAELLHRLFPTRAGAIDVVNTNGTTWRAEFSSGTDSCYVTVSGRDRIVRVPAPVLHVFDEDIASMRDRRLVRFGLSKAFSITLAAEGTTTTIVKRDEDWSYANPTLGTIDQSAVVSFITLLQNFRFRQILAGLPPAHDRFDIDRAPFHLIVSGADGRAIDEFMAGGNIEQGNIRYAFSRSLDRWGIVDEELLDKLAARFEGFRLP